MSNYAAALRQAGMSPSAAEEKDATFQRLQRAAKIRGFQEPLRAFYVPGRIEVLGKHTDYAGGRSLVCCVERGFCLMASRRDDATIRFIDLSTNSTADWKFAPTSPVPPIAWAIYPATVTRRVARNFPSAQNGVDVLFSSDLPPAAGMSSSSALVIASFLAIAAANQLEDTEKFRENLATAENLATYLACVENGSSFRSLSGDAGVGTFGGSEDHTAILCCEVGKISQYSFCPSQRERSIELPDDLTFIIGTSGVAAEKTGKALQRYNQLSLGISSILEMWNAATGRHDQSLGAALQSSGNAADQIRELFLDPQLSSLVSGGLRNRFEQFLAETETIVPDAGDALSVGDWRKFGKLVDLSQNAAERLLENQIPETSFLAKSARELGAIAASAFGAGFGGSVWALLPKKNSCEFMEQWAAHYQTQFPQRTSATFFATAAGPPAGWL